MVLRAAAAGRRWPGNSFGSIAVRVGWPMEKNDCWTARSASTIHTFSLPRNACRNSPNVMTMSPVVAMASRVRRSIESASAPPHRPNTMSGARATSPASPTYAELPVIS